MWDWGKIMFFEQKCRNQDQFMCGARRTKKGRKYEDYDPSADRHLVPDPLDNFLFRFIYFHFQFKPNFLQILTFFHDFLGPQGEQINSKKIN